jgi:hypothetical protein
MIVQMFLAEGEVRGIMWVRTPRFREERGLLQEFYCYKETTCMHGHLYL